MRNPVPFRRLFVVAIALATATLLGGCAGNTADPGRSDGSATSLPGSPTASTDATAGPTSSVTAPVLHSTSDASGVTRSTVNDGTYSGLIKKLAGDDLTYDPIEYFEGAAAEKACAQDGVTPGAGAVCHDFYVRNPDPALVVVPLSPSLRVRVYGDTPAEGRVPVTVSQLRAHLINHGTGYNTDSKWTVTIRGGQLVALDQIFTP